MILRGDASTMYKPALLILGVLLIVACGGSEQAQAPTPTASPAPTPTATPAPISTPAVQITADTPTAQAILEGSFAAMERIKSFKFELEATIKASSEGGAVPEIPFVFTADYQAPDRVQGKLTLSLGFFTVETETIIIGDQVYTTDSETGEWSVNAGAGIDLPNPRDFTAGVATAMEKAVLARTESLDGKPVYVVEGAPSLDLFKRTEGEPETTFWIGIDDLLIRRIVANGEISLEEVAAPLGLPGITGTATIAMDIRFSAFGTPVEILPPAVGAGTKADGPGRKIEDQGRAHVRPGDSHPPYNSVPATSGWHYPIPQAPAPWGVYDEVLPDEVLVHNLEHGGVGVHYDCPDGCDDLVAQLAAIVSGAVGQGFKIVMSPYPGLETRIVLTAWNFLAGFEEFDAQRMLEFVRAHESSPNAPESRVP